MKRTMMILTVLGLTWVTATRQNSELRGAQTDEPRVAQGVVPIYDVLVYGGTPAGIAAAVAAADGGRTVILVEPYRQIGGLVTNGLSHPDFRTFEGLSGKYLELIHDAEAYYSQRYGASSEQAIASFHGTHAEPHVNREVFESWLAQRPLIKVLKNYRLETLDFDPTQRRINMASFRTPQDEWHTTAARVFIDATYEGDLMAKAGVASRVGREGRAEYGESLAPEQPDDQLQGYNFRQIMTRVAENRVLPEKPVGYRREDFLPLLDLYASGKLQTVFCENHGGIWKTQIPLPNQKHDVNDVSRGVVRRSMPGSNLGWPTGDAEARAQIHAEHLRHDLGMLYFLQNDDAVPARLRDEAREWGLCRDEFADTGHVPEQIYVREARRMVGQHVFCQKDTEHAPGDARGVLKTDAIAIGDYGLNCHGTHHAGPHIGGEHSGEFYQGTPPYQIPYRALVPREFDNLLVPVAVSSSHVGFCALRLEPIWTALGHAAGIAADVALDDKTTVSEASVAVIQRRLHAERSATVYVSDVPPRHADFAAVQWWGTLGGLHGLAPAPSDPRKVRGQNIRGQYYEAFPGHAAELNRPLDDAIRARWTELAVARGVDPVVASAAQTRGEFIRAAFAARPRSSASPSAAQAVD